MEKEKTGLGQGDSYLCGQCFTWHKNNDVLFDGGASCRGCDVRQAAHRYAFADAEDYRAWCAAGRRRVLLDWQDFPPHRRRQSGNMLTGLQDSDGQWRRVRVCPGCHSPVTDVQGQLLAGWDAGGLNLPRARQLLAKASAEGAEWQEENPETRRKDGALEYARFFHSGRQTTLALPLGLQQGRGSYAQGCRLRLGENISAGLLWLDLSGLDRLKPGQPLLDGGAQDTLTAFLKFAGYEGRRLALPVAVLVEGAPADNLEKTMEEHTFQLLARLHNSLASMLLLPWDESGNTARQAGDWLAARLAPPEAETSGRTEEIRR